MTTVSFPWNVLLTCLFNVLLPNSDGETALFVDTSFHIHTHWGKGAGRRTGRFLKTRVEALLLRECLPINLHSMSDSLLSRAYLTIIHYVVFD